MTEYWYRYEDPESSNDPIYLSRYEVLKRTEKGVWINHYSTKHGKFILNDSHKQFACPTIEEAKVSYIKRKERQVKILAAQHDRAVESLRAAKEDRFQAKSYVFTSSF